MKLIKWFGAAVTGVAVASAAFAQEQDSSTNRVAAKTDWSVFVDESPKECWSVSTPKETVNTRNGNVVAVNRGQILLMVSFRPSEQINGQVAFTGGYPFAGRLHREHEYRRDRVRIVHRWRMGMARIRAGRRQDRDRDEARRECGGLCPVQPWHANQGHVQPAWLYGGSGRCRRPLRRINLIGGAPLRGCPAL